MPTVCTTLTDDEQEQIVDFAKRHEISVSSVVRQMILRSGIVTPSMQRESDLFVPEFK